MVPIASVLYSKLHKSFVWEMDSANLHLFCADVLVWTQWTRSM